MDDVRLQIVTLRAQNNCCCMIFSETWLDSSIPDAAIKLAGCTVSKQTGPQTLVRRRLLGEIELWTRCIQSTGLPTPGFVRSPLSSPALRVCTQDQEYRDYFQDGEDIARICYLHGPGQFSAQCDVFTDQNMDTCENLGNYTITVLNYISCVDNVTSWKQFCIFPNMPTWMTH